MLKRFFVLLLPLVLLSSCAHRGPRSASAQAAEDAPSVRIKQYRQVSDFNQVDAQGRINLSLHTGYKKPQVILHGDARDLQQVKTHEENEIGRAHV